MDNNVNSSAICWNTKSVQCRNSFGVNIVLTVDSCIYAGFRGFVRYSVCVSFFLGCVMPLGMQIWNF